VFLVQSSAKSDAITPGSFLLFVIFFQLNKKTPVALWVLVPRILSLLLRFLIPSSRQFSVCACRFTTLRFVAATAHPSTAPVARLLVASGDGENIVYCSLRQLGHLLLFHFSSLHYAQFHT
jgi:hypothetical protein